MHNKMGKKNEKALIKYAIYFYILIFKICEELLKNRLRHTIQNKSVLVCY